MSDQARRGALSPDEAPTYTPLSGLAVAALGVAVIGAVGIAAILWAARQAGKPAFEPWLLLGPVAGLLLGLLARRQVVRSEGAQTGRSLATAGVFVSILAGGSYAAYLVATDLAIRSQATVFAKQWFQKAVEGSTAGSFLLTLDGPTRQTLNEKDVSGLRARFGREMMLYEGFEILRILRRAGGKYEVEVRGVNDWSMFQGGYRVDLNMTLHTPEGRYNFTLPVYGRDTIELGGRTWQLLATQVRLDNADLTRLGRLIFEAMLQSRKHMTTWTEHVNDLKLIDAYKETLPLAERSAPGLESSAGFAAFKDGALVRRNGAELPDAERKAIGADILRPYGVNINPGNAMNRVGPPVVEFVDNRVTLDHMTELNQLSGAVPMQVMVELLGDELVAEINKLRSATDWKTQKTEPTRGEPNEIRKFPQWGFRIVRFDVRPDQPRLAPPGPAPGAGGGP